MTTEKFFKIGIILCTISVVLGAFSAHLLKDILSNNSLTSFRTGVRYQFLHGLITIILSLNSDKFKNKILIRSLWLFLIGIILFSFSIYILSIQTILEINLNILGPVTPIGGLILISAWINLLFSIRKKNDN